VWFNLGDRDLAAGVRRQRQMDEGARLTDILAELALALDVTARVLPMTDDPVRTRVRHAGRWWPFQEYMIRAGGGSPVEGVEFESADRAAATPEVLNALGSARAVVIGPSNPVVSIGPILAVPGIRQAIGATWAPVVAVSPIVRGKVVKGPTDPFMRWAGWEPSAPGIAEAYAGIIDGLVADEAAEGIPLLQTDTLMNDAASRRRVAEETLRFAEGLAP
jgi:LPPG:FO 2-phospho-L-lactate transferase